MKYFVPFLFSVALLAEAAEINAPESVKQHLKSVEIQEDGEINVVSIVKGDINGDNREDIVVHYELTSKDGGNFALLGDALYIGKSGGYQFVDLVDSGSVGVGVGTQMSAEKIEPGKIIFGADEFGPDDGPCCPSIHKKVVYLLKDGKLIPEEAPTSKQ